MVFASVSLLGKDCCELVAQYDTYRFPEYWDTCYEEVGVVWMTFHPAHIVLLQRGFLGECHRLSDMLLGWMHADTLRAEYTESRALHSALVVCTLPSVYSAHLA